MIKNMGYEVAKSKAWEDLCNFNAAKKLAVKFLADEYEVDLENKRVVSLSCNALTKDFPAIIILHYLISKLKGLPKISGDWLTFRELSDIEGYADAFRRRSIEPIIRKYGSNPQGLFSVLDRLPGEKIMAADAGIIVQAFEGIPAMIKVWKPDEEFGPDANIYFDRSIKDIFCTEDIVVLAGIIASSL